MAKKKKTKTTNSSVAFYEFHTLNPSEWASEMKQKLDSVKQNQEYLLSQENYTYDTFVKPLEISNENLLTVFTPLSHLNSVMNSSETEKAYMECDSLLTEYFTSQSQDKRIYDVYKKIYQKERKQLNAEKVKVLENSLRDFKLSGAFLSKKKKQELMNINLRLSELSNTFSQNLIKATNEYELIISDKEAVKEIPGSDLKLAECKHEGKKAWKFTLQMPS
ncbi:MAG: M3 family peptidase, partial [Leptospiraceae bacterium]|nr:M3 family peptidase [Leptospiraceae bacterium]